MRVTMSRPTKLTTEVQETITAALRIGNYQDTAVSYAGISEATFYAWMQRGRTETGTIFSEFLEAVEKAKADAEVRDLMLIDRAAQDGTWQAAAWKLERKFPHKWGRMVRAEVSGPEGAPIKVEVDAKAELKRLLGIVDADPDT